MNFADCGKQDCTPVEHWQRVAFAAIKDRTRLLAIEEAARAYVEWTQGDGIGDDGPSRYERLSAALRDALSGSLMLTASDE